MKTNFVARNKYIIFYIFFFKVSQHHFWIHSLGS